MRIPCPKYIVEHLQRPRVRKCDASVAPDARLRPGAVLQLVSPSISENGAANLDGFTSAEHIIIQRKINVDIAHTDHAAFHRGLSTRIFSSQTKCISAFIQLRRCETIKQNPILDRHA